MIEGACFVTISISISFVCFSLSDLVGKFTFLSPWHMLFFSCIRVVKGGAYFVGILGCSY